MPYACGGTPLLDSPRTGRKERKGWIFITSTPDTIDALRPIQSLWLDMLILKLQTACN